MQYRHLSTVFIDGNIVKEESFGEFSLDCMRRETSLVTLYPQKEYQKWHGFGGAITEAVGFLLSSLPLPLCKRLLMDCFGETGLNYRWIRTHIDSCDFCLSAYESCDHVEFYPPRIDRESFATHDGQYIIPFIFIAQDIQPELALYLVPWSPPAFMKSHGMRQGGGELLPLWRQHWCDYICAYIRQYEDLQIPVAFIGLQNEPLATQEWDSCVYSAEDESTIIHQHLRPSLDAHNLSHVTIVAYDHNRERAFERIEEMQPCMSRDDIGAVAFHWYSGDHFENIQMLREAYPEYLLIFSEGCIEYKHHNPEAELTHAQHYAHHIIGDMNHGAHLWFDWNIALDPQGGPNYVHNYCASPITIDTHSGTYITHLSYEYIRHFSSYIKAGAKRIGFSSFSKELEMTAWKLEDNSIVLVSMNPQDKDIIIYLRIGTMIAPITLLALSINTILISS